MLKRFAYVAGLTLLLGIVFAPPAHASTRISVRIGAPVPIAPVAVVARPRGLVWRPGYRVWTGVGYRWVPGVWVPAPYARGYWAPRWRERGRPDWRRDRREWDRRGYWRR
jgi:hypothetical protein